MLCVKNLCDHSSEQVVLPEFLRVVYRLKATRKHRQKGRHDCQVFARVFQQHGIWGGRRNEKTYSVLTMSCKKFACLLFMFNVYLAPPGQDALIRRSIPRTQHSRACSPLILLAHITVMLEPDNRSLLEQRKQIFACIFRMVPEVQVVSVNCKGSISICIHTC